jgi:nitroreductase
LEIPCNFYICHARKVKVCFNRERIKDTPHFLLVHGLRDQVWNRNYDGYNSVETDVAIAMTHIVLVAENEGVWAYWIAAYNPALLKEPLNPEENELIFGITLLGYPKPGFLESLIKKRKSLEEIAEFM